MAEEKQKYDAESIKILEGLEGVRRRFDLVELSKKIKKKGDILVLSQELKIKPRILAAAKDEGRIKAFFPTLNKSKFGILSCLRTNRELVLFSQKYDIYNTFARNLIKLVGQWNKEVQMNPLILVTQEEHDLFIGSLLGDASIRQRQRNSCYRVAHTIKQKEYIDLKLKLLNKFNISEFINKRRVIKGREVNMIYLSTDTHPIFNYYRTLFYKDNRKIINEEILNQINSRSLAFWICDDGSYDNTQRYIVLCTNAFTFEEHKLMKEFFHNKFNLDPTIGFRDGKYYFLRFKQEDSKKLIKIIKPFVPESMKYKIEGMKNGC